MDTAPDAPADSTLDEQRPKGTPEQQLASFGADSAEAAEPEKPEEEKKATAGAERSVGGAESPDAAPSSNNETVLESRVQANFSPPNTTQPSREIGPDSAAAPVSPPASDRNATTSAQVKQTVRKLALSGFLCGIGHVRIAHDSPRRIGTRPASVAAGGGGRLCRLGQSGAVHRRLR